MNIDDLEKELEKKIKAIDVGNPDENLREKCINMAIGSKNIDYYDIIDQAEKYFKYIRKGNENA